MRELILMVIAITVHECGHLLFASLIGVKLRSVNLSSVGSVLSFNFSGVGYLKEALVHLSGSALGIAVALAVYLAYGERTLGFLGLSLLLSAVNLLPINGFDGGGVVKCILLLYFLPDTAWRVGRVLSIIGVVLLWSAVLWIELRAGGNISLMIFVIGIMLGQMK